MRGSRGRARATSHDDEPWGAAEIDGPSTTGPLADGDDSRACARTAHRPHHRDVARGRPRATAASRRIRIAWVAVALVALLGFAVGNRLSVDHVAGAAGGVWHEGPAVGSCVDLTGGFAVVACDGPHDAEVTRVDGPRPSRQMLVGQSDQDAGAVCRRAAADYAGSESVGAGVTGGDDWLGAAINDASTVVSAPRGERTGPFGWTACAVRPAVAHRYLGSVRGAADGGIVPAAYRTCFGPGGAGDAVSCAAPHTSEQVALLPGSPLDEFGWEMHGSADEAGTDEAGGAGDGGAGARDPGATDTDGGPDDLGMSGIAAISFAEIRDDLHAQCEQAASAVLGTDDPTYGGRLTIETAPGENSGPIVVWQMDPDRDGGVSREWQVAHAIGLSGPNLCVVRTVGGGRLTDSLIGWGDAPLPLTDS